MTLWVYYGYTKLNKISKKRELAVMFENEWGGRNEDWLARRMVIAFKRKQTEQEMADAKGQNRVFTKYSLFIDDKPFSGNIRKVLDTNRQADINNVQDDVLSQIYESCLKIFKQLYPKRYDPKNLQLDLF